MWPTCSLGYLYFATYNNENLKNKIQKEMAKVALFWRIWSRWIVNQLQIWTPVNLNVEQLQNSLTRCFVTFTLHHHHQTIVKRNNNNTTCRAVVVVVKWSAYTPSTPTIRVRIPLTSTNSFYSWKLFEENENKTNKGSGIAPIIIQHLFKYSHHSGCCEVTSFRGPLPKTTACRFQS